MAIVDRHEKSVTSLQEDSVDKMFETFKSLKQSQDKAMQAKQEHENEVAAFNNKNMLDPNASFMIDPRTNKPVPIPEDLNRMRKAGFREGAKIEAEKTVNALLMLNKMYADSGLPAPNMIPSVGEKGNISFRGSNIPASSPSLEKVKIAKIEDLINTFTDNATKIEQIDEVESSLETLTSGIYGKVGRGFSKNLAPDSPGLQDYQNVKSFLTDVTLGNVKFTKGAISDAEMELFKEASANDDLISSPRIKSAINNVKRKMQAEEMKKVSSFKKIYGEDPTQWDEIKNIRKSSESKTQEFKVGGTTYRIPSDQVDAFKKAKGIK